MYGLFSRKSLKKRHLDYNRSQELILKEREGTSNENLRKSRVSATDLKVRVMSPRVLK